MKKILYIFLASLFMGASYAEYDFTQAIEDSSMPTDSEIRAVIGQLNFTKEQEDAIFKETKRKLKIMYSGKNTAQTNKELNLYMNQIDSETLSPYIDNSTKQELKRSFSQLPTTTSSNSKKD